MKTSNVETAINALSDDQPIDAVFTELAQTKQALHVPVPIAPQNVELPRDSVARRAWEMAPMQHSFSRRARKVDREDSGTVTAWLMRFARIACFLLGVFCLLKAIPGSPLRSAPASVTRLVSSPTGCNVRPPDRTHLWRRHKHRGAVVSGWPREAKKC